MKRRTGKTLSAAAGVEKAGRLILQVRRTVTFQRMLRRGMYALIMLGLLVYLGVWMFDPFTQKTLGLILITGLTLMLCSIATYFVNKWLNDRLKMFEKEFNTLFETE